MSENTRVTLKRGGLMIANDILQTCVGGSGITAVVYGCNLNFVIARRHLAGLVDKDLVTVETVNYRKGDPVNLWTTTDRGLEFIHRMMAVLSLWDMGEKEEIEDRPQEMIPGRP